MNELFLKIINMSISASWLILAVLILRLVLKKAPKWVNVLLWGIVAVRLICPLSFESALSLIPSSETIPLDIEMAAKPTIDSGVPAINSVVNPVLSSFAPPQHVLTSANPLQIWIPILNIIWLIGVGALLLYTAVSYWRLCRKVDTAVRYKGNIFQSENVSSPFVLGIIKPRIYLPFNMNDCLQVEGFSSNVDEPAKYYLTIGAEGVKSIELTMPNSSGGCENADGSLFKKGERIWLENLDGYTDLRGLTITALGENGEIIWTASIPNEDENQGFTHLVNDDWEITNIE